MWDCTVLVLYPKVQNDHNLPKWNRRSCLSQFIGFSDEHSYLVANVQYLSTGYISLQFHLVFDDLFEEVIFQGDNDSTIEAICSEIILYQLRLVRRRGV